MERAIIHLNIADFAVAVETGNDPSLRDRPLIIAPLGAPRAVVYDMSEQAYKEGIRKGMPLARARRLNRKTKIIPPNFNRYEQAMKTLIKETFAFTPLIESGTRDGHVFMDVTGSRRLFGPARDVAFKLQKTFKKQFCLDPIWSVATNKLVAKVATRIVKPVGEYIVLPGDEPSFLGPLPVHLIPGIEKTDLTRLHEFNLCLVSQARVLTLEQLKVPFNYRARLIYDRLRGIDTAPVTPVCETGAAIRADHEFADDTNHAGMLQKALFLMVENIGQTLRRRNMHGAAARIVLSYSDGLQSVARTKIYPSTSSDLALYKKGIRLLEKAWTRRVRVRHMRLVCEKVLPGTVQAELFSPKTRSAGQADLFRAIDRIRSKFGKKAVQSGLALMTDTV